MSDTPETSRAALEHLERMPRLTPVRAENSEAFKELMKLRRAVFERLERMVRPIPDLDEKKELDDWCWEKFGDVREMHGNAAGSNTRHE